MSIRVLQLTDLHLFADPAARLKGVPTRDSLVDVLQFIRAHDEDFQCLVLTGDLAHDEQEETYVALRELLGEELTRCRLIPGNHDNRESIRRVFPELVAGPDGAVTFSFEVGGWRLIGLDSHLPGEVSGQIDDEQLDWLEEQLARHSQQPTLLFMHHPFISVNSIWLDQIGLRQPGRLIDIVMAADQVQAVCAGHVHQESDGRLGDTAVYTSPSTAIQFRPGCAEPQYDLLPPGYRAFVFNGNTYRTEVIRLPQVRYPPVSDEA